MKFGVSSYSFSQYMRAGKLTQLSAVAKAKEMGFDDIEFTDLTPPEGTSQMEYAKQIREEAEKCGIEISAYVIGANLAQPEVDKEVERLKGCLDIAKELGVKLLRHDTMWNYEYYRSFDDALPVMAKAIREVTEYAAQLGIKTMTENHGLIAQDSTRIERLIAAVNHPNFGTLVDMGNFACADEDSAQAVSRVANLAFLVHAKDFIKVPFAEYKGQEGMFQTRGCNWLKGVAVGDGDVPVAQCIAILKRAGFDGYVDLEYEGAEDCIEGCAKGLKYLRSL